MLVLEGTGRQRAGGGRGSSQLRVAGGGPAVCSWRAWVLGANY